MANKLIRLASCVALSNIMAMPTGKTYEAHAEGEETSISVGGAEASSEQEALSSYDGTTSLENEGSSVGETPSEAPSESKEEEAWKDIEEYVKELERQIESFNSTKFLNGTIGGLISSALTLLLYAVIKLAERKGWRTRTELFSRANGLLDNVQSKVDGLHATQRISEEQYKAATKAVTDAAQLLNSTNEKLNDTDAEVGALKAELEAKYNETMESVKKDYDVLLAKYEKLLAMFLEMAKSSSDMVKSGAYERMVEINSASDSAEGE